MASLPPKPPPPAQSAPPLPSGWTEHKAPTGHSYYYNAQTKTSTYTRPVAGPLPPPVPVPPHYTPPPQRFGLGQPPTAGPFAPGAPRYSSPTGPFPVAGHQLPHCPYFQGGHGSGGPQARGTFRPPPQDRPKKKRVIPGAEPWVLVTTKMGRAFVHNLSTKISLWSAPKDVQEKIDVMPPVVREQEKRERAERRKRRAAEKAAAEAEARRQKSVSVVAEKGDAGGGGAEGEPTTKKPRLEGDQEDQGMDEVEGEEEEEEKEEEEEEDEQPPPNQPPAAQEFTEEDIAWQLEAMAEQYGLEEEDFEEGDELAPEESTNLFREMLEEYSISPYSTWDDALPRFVDDHRYTVLSTTKARKEVFTAWCKDKSSQLRQEKEKAKKTDPRIPFWDFLNEHTTSKLFWAEFKRKWRKEPAMRDSKLSDKEREKMYRDYVARTKGSEPVRENDLKKLLKSISSLSKQTTLLTLPDSVIADVRYVTAPESSRERIITEYLSTLPDAPMSEAERKENEERERREKALREREWAVRQEKRRNAAEEAAAKQFLKEEEAAIERAKKVGKKGLLGHLKKEEEAPPPTYEDV